MVNTWLHDDETLFFVFIIPALALAVSLFWSTRRSYDCKKKKKKNISNKNLHKNKIIK